MVKSLWQPQRLALLLGLSALLLIAGACGEEKEDVGVSAGEPIERSPETPIVIPAGEPIIVGVSTALTGGAVGMRGAEYRDAAIVAVERWKEANGEQFGGHEIEVVAEDDGCTETDIAVEAARRLLEHGGLVGVLGPQCSAGTAAAISLDENTTPRELDPMKVIARLAADRAAIAPAFDVLRDLLIARRDPAP